MLSKSIKLAAVGDVALTHNYDQSLHVKGPDWPFESIKTFLKSHDLVFGNLEAPFCIDGEIYHGKCSLRTHPDYITGLANAGFNIMSIANNHILDYKELAFFNTIKILRKDMNYFGAGKDIKEAKKASIIEQNGIRVGFIGYCDVIIDSPFYATNNKRGIAPFQIESVVEDITKLKDQVDVIIISLHWGMEHYSYPTPEQVKAAHKLINSGADLIIGHHPHVLQGIEKYKHGYIAYSLGNFIFSDIKWSWVNKNGKKIDSLMRLNKKNRKGVILSVLITKKGIQDVNAFPCVLAKNLQVRLVEKATNRNKRLNKLTKKLYLNNYDKFWYRYSSILKYKTLMTRNIKRLKNIHKLRPAHIKELSDIITPPPSRRS